MVLYSLNIVSFLHHVISRIQNYQITQVTYKKEDKKVQSSTAMYKAPVCSYSIFLRPRNHCCDGYFPMPKQRRCCSKNPT